MSADDAEDRLLEVRDLRVDYRTGRVHTPAVRGVDLDVSPGEFVTVVGESGSGKSTLVHAALGLLPGAARISGGSVTYSGVDVTGWTDKMALVRGNHVGFIPQDPNTSLNPVKRIGRQVVEAVRFNQPKSSQEDPVERALESLRTAGLSDAERVYDAYPHELSGGMKQRALIAIALAGRPQLIVADEPTSALDVTVQKRILDHLVGLRDELGIGVLLVTHDLGVALERSDRILVMQQGEVVESGPVAHVRDHASDPYTRRLLAAAPSRHEGRLAPQRVRTTKPDDTVVVAARGLDKAYRVRGRSDDLHALRDVDLVVRTGTTHAIVGESGAGKSTLAGVLAGFATPDAGDVRVGEQDLGALGRRELRELRRDLQFVFQNPFTSLDPRFSVERIIAEPLRAFGLVKGRAERSARVADLLEQVALDPAFASRLPRQLSGGQRQRVAIARALALNPRVLVLDEAVSALDVSVQSQILQLLVDLQAQRDLSYVFVTHDLGVVRLIADDVSVMKDGAVVETGTLDEVFAAPRHPYTRELLAAIPGAQTAPA